MSGYQFPLELRVEACHYVENYGLQAAADRYGVCTATVARWRRELGFRPINRQARRAS